MKFRIIFIVIFCLFFQTTHAERFIPDSDLTKRVLDIVDQLYVDNKRIIPSKMLDGALDNLSASIAPVLTRIEADQQKTTIEIRVDQFNRTFEFNTPKNVQELNDILQLISKFVKQHLESDEKPENVDYAMINGFLAQLDPHSSLLIPEIYSDFSTNTTGNFGGVGMMIGLRDGALTIIAPIDNTPASRTGLKAKDRIVQIDDESTINMSLTDAVKKLRGEKGTKVDIYIMRKGFTSPKKFTIIRDIIEITSVESHVFKEKDKRVGYLKINTFQQNTMDEINSSLDDLDYNLNDFLGLVIDLRNNPGGLLDQAIKVSDRFLSDGVIVSTAGVNSKSIKSFKASWLRSIEDMPIIVLVNNGSASASEIVTAALKKNNRAVVLGIQTFGKGSVQQVIPFKDGSALRLTTSKYLTPGNISIQSVGVTPHITVTPYFISNDFLHVTSPRLDSAEKSLDQNFAEWGDKAEKSLKTIYYLYKDDDNLTQEQEELGDPNEIKLERIKNDFLIQTAVQILVKNSGKDFNHLLKTSLSYCDVMEKQQKQAVIDKFASFSTPIDWNTYPTEGPGKVSSRIWLEIKTEKNSKESWQKYSGPVLANSDIRLYVEAKNIGKTRISRLMAITESENAIFDDRQFAFGKLDPGDAKQWFIPIKISESSDSRNDLIKFKFTDQEKRNIATDKFALIVKEQPKPRFTYQLVPYEDGQYQSKGNGDDFLEPAETVTIRLTITNSGSGESGPLTLLLKNGEGKDIFLKKGRQMLDSLKSGESKASLFTFELKQIPDDQDLDFSLDILDGTFPQSSFKYKFKMPLDVKKATLQNTPPTIKVLEKDLVSSKRNFDLDGIISDPEGVKDVYIFNNNKKIFYKNFLKLPERKKVDFNLELHLNEDNNRVLIFARDDDNVVVQKTVYLRFSNSI